MVLTMESSYRKNFPGRGTTLSTSTSEAGASTRAGATGDTTSTVLRYY